MTPTRERIIPGRFAGQRALVTGAARGIGRAIALRLAAEGAIVGFNYRTRDDEADKLIEEIEASGGSAFAIKAVIGEPGAIEQLFASLDEGMTARAGDNRLDILVKCRHRLGCGAD